MPCPALRLIPLLCAAAATVSAVELSIAPDRADGVYQPGQTVTWTVTAKGQAPASLPYTVKSGGAAVTASGAITFSGDSATVSASRSDAGTLLLTIPHDGRNSYGGAACDWSRIPASAPEPEDFDAFWQAKIAELAAVPADPRLEEVASGTPGVKLWTITMGNIRGSSIRGYFARPDGEAPCPAMLAVQWAGVYPLDKGWSVSSAKDGWMVLNISAHDLPIAENADFYKKAAEGALKNYPQIGAEDRETAYFLRMFLACHRGAEYLVKRPDWNRATLLAQGGSQGGLQAMVAAALHPAVTVVTANIPAGCDHTGADIGRAPGWPKLVNTWSNQDPARLRSASRYFDAVNFAARVRCPVLVGMGLIDTTCPPDGVFALFNRIAAPKRLVIMPLADHMSGHGDYYAAMGAWWSAAKAGKPLPMR
jgi:cephalosporin-C deacetylase-like acetyl esterase